MLFRVEALVAVPLHAEKLNVLPGLGALLVLGTGRSGSLIWLGDLWDRQRLSSTSWAGASRESVMVGNRGPVLERHHSLTSCFTNSPTITARYITTAPHFPNLLASNLDSEARYIIKYAINYVLKEYGPNGSVHWTWHSLDMGGGGKTCFKFKFWVKKREGGVNFDFSGVSAQPAQRQTAILLSNDHPRNHLTSGTHTCTKAWEPLIPSQRVTPKHGSP